MAEATYLQANAREFLEANGNVIAALTIGARAVADLVAESPQASPEEYTPLLERVWKWESQLTNGPILWAAAPGRN